MNKKHVWTGIPACILVLYLQSGCIFGERNVELIPKAPVTAPLSGYELHPDEGVIYNPLSREAQKTGRFNLYDQAEKTTGVIENDFYKLEYNFPKNIRPYDVAPLTYTLTKKGEQSSPVTVSATAFENESLRKGRDLYDLSIPGELTLDFEYLGYEYLNRELPFHDWNAAINDLDAFRTAMRIKNYGDLLAEIQKVDPQTKMALRTEGGNIMVAGIDPTIDNDHYRHVFYSQRRNAIIAEDIINSGVFRSHSDYTTLPYTPSELRELIGVATRQGIQSMLLPQFDNMRDIVINPRYGDDSYTINYNATNKVYGAMVHVLSAVYPWWEATYDAGGVPGILWQDLQCDGFVTETQMKEMLYFKQKMDAALNTKKALTDRQKTGKPVNRPNDKVIRNYEPDFLQSVIDKVFLHIE